MGSAVELAKWWTNVRGVPTSALLCYAKRL